MFERTRHLGVHPFRITAEHHIRPRTVQNARSKEARRDDVAAGECKMSPDITRTDRLRKTKPKLSRRERTEKRTLAARPCQTARIRSSFLALGRVPSLLFDLPRVGMCVRETSGRIRAASTVTSTSTSNGWSARWTSGTWRICFWTGLLDVRAWAVTLDNEKLILADLVKLIGI